MRNCTHRGGADKSEVQILNIECVLKPIFIISLRRLEYFLTNWKPFLRTERERDSLITDRFLCLAGRIFSPRIDHLISKLEVLCELMQLLLFSWIYSISFTVGRGLSLQELESLHYEYQNIPKVTWTLLLNINHFGDLFAEIDYSFHKNFIRIRFLVCNKKSYAVVSLKRAPHDSGSRSSSCTAVFVQQALTAWRTQ